MNNIKNKIKAVIFDLDGTILNTEHIWTDATEQYLTSLNINIHEEETQKLLLSFSGCHLRDTATQLKERFSIPDSVDQILEAKRTITMRLFKEATSLSFIEGFKEFHQQLVDHGIPHCIATNADDVSLKGLIAGSNVNLLFKNIFNITCVGNKAKPDPALFLHAAQQLGVDPKDCVIFEDSFPGFTAAKAAGIKCIAIKSNMNSKHLHLVDQAINNYHEALDALKKLI